MDKIAESDEMKELFETVKGLLAKYEVPISTSAETYDRLQKILSKGDPDIKRVEAIIYNDPILPDLLLKAANSAHNRPLRKITSLQGALMRIGINETLNILKLLNGKGFFRKRNFLSDN